MKHLTIGRRILASFTVVLALMAIRATGASSRLTSIERQAALITTDAVPGLTYTNEILIARIANDALTQEFALHTDVPSRRKTQAGASQITQALAQLSEAAQQTVESLQQSEQAINGLNQAAISMRNGVSRFKVAA
jgi:hypothetical protein